MKKTIVCVAFLLGTIAAGCSEPVPGQRWPGPCKAEWTVYNIIDVAGWRIPTFTRDGKSRVIRYAYQHGLLSSIESDEDGDGTFDSRILLYHDEEGRVIREVLDRGVDGSMDEERAFSYTDVGEPIGFYREEGTDALAPIAMEQGHAPMMRLWEVCQGTCTYDAYGNMLEDRDRGFYDVVHYDYGCWSP